VDNGRELYGYTVYRNPRDYPGRFVVRRWRVRAGGALETERTTWAVEHTLEAARATIPPNLYRMERHPDDDPVIVEVWL
jgi:hypothetical protein